MNNTTNAEFLSKIIKIRYRLLIETYLFNHSLGMKKYLLRNVANHKFSTSAKKVNNRQSLSCVGYEKMLLHNNIEYIPMT